jgi:uncharacterized protein YcnI
MWRTSARRAAVVLGSAVLAVGMWATPAAANVTVAASDASPGGDGTLTFSVPSDRKTGNTTGVRVAFPTETPFENVQTKAPPGWSARPEVGTTTGGKGITGVSWSATNPKGQLKYGKTGQFKIIAEGLPKSKKLEFKVQQSYSDGTELVWDAKSNPGPVLTVQDGKFVGQDVADTASSSWFGALSTPTIVMLAAAVVLGGIAVFLAVRQNRAQTAIRNYGASRPWASRLGA